MKSIKKIGFLIMAMGLIVLTACGKTELEKTIEGKGSGNEAEDKASHIVSISDGTMNLLGDDKADIEAILDDYGIAQEEGKRKGGLTDGKYEEVKEKVLLLIKEKNEAASNENLTVKSDPNTGTMDIECTGITYVMEAKDKINALCAMEGVFERIESSKEEWSVEVFVVVVNNNGEETERKIVEVSETKPFEL